MNRQKRLALQIAFAVFNALAAGLIAGLLAHFGGANYPASVGIGAAIALKDTQSLLTSLHKLIGDVGQEGGTNEPVSN